MKINIIIRKYNDSYSIKHNFPLFRPYFCVITPQTEIENPTDVKSRSHVVMMAIFQRSNAIKKLKRINGVRPRPCKYLNLSS